MLVLSWAVNPCFKKDKKIIKMLKLGQNEEYPFGHTKFYNRN